MEAKNVTLTYTSRVWTYEERKLNHFQILLLAPQNDGKSDTRGSR